MDEPDRRPVSYADIARQWRLLSLQTRRLALFLQGSGQEEAMRRAARFEETAKLLERKARESTAHADAGGTVGSG